MEQLNCTVVGSVPDDYYYLTWSCLTRRRARIVDPNLFFSSYHLGLTTIASSSQLVLGKLHVIPNLIPRPAKNNTRTIEPF